MHVPCLGAPPVWAGVRAQESSGDRLPLVGAPSSRSGQRTGCAPGLPGMALYSNDVTKKPCFILFYLLGRQRAEPYPAELRADFVLKVTPGRAQGTYTVRGAEMWSAACVRGRQAPYPLSYLFYPKKLSISSSSGKRLAGRCVLIQVCEPLDQLYPSSVPYHPNTYINCSSLIATQYPGGSQNTLHCGTP